MEFSLGMVLSLSLVRFIVIFLGVLVSLFFCMVWVVYFVLLDERWFRIG